MDTKQKIRLAVEKLAARPFDWDGAGGLPIRPDVAEWCRESLFSDFAGIGLDAAALDAVGVGDVSLNQDGTVELALESEGKELILTVECGGVVSYIKLFEDAQTSVEGMVRCPAPFEGLSEIDDHLAWLGRE
jgi:hypothetical protein